MPENDRISLRNKILSSSRKLLLDEGYRNISMRKIANEIDISATSIYLYFENKDHLIHTLIELSIDRLNRNLENSIKDLNDPVACLERLAQTYVDFAMKNPEEYHIIYQVDSDNMSRYPKEKFRKARKGYELVTKTIELGVKNGQMEEEHPRLASYIFWAQLHGVMSVVLTKRLDIRIDREQFIREAIDHIIQSLQIRTAVVD